MYSESSKLYENIALGLPVISSANPTMVELIEKRGFGFCAGDDSPEALAKTIEKLFSVKDHNEIRKREIKAFREELCFEEIPVPVLNKICNLRRDGPH